MSESIGLFITLLVLDSTAILLSILLLILYFKLQVLMRPPGSLILMQILTMLVLRIDEVLFHFIDHDSSHYIYYNFSSCLYIYALIVLVSYAISTSLEVIRRFRNSPMGKNYRKRAVLYHIFCHLTALIYTLIVINYSTESKYFQTISFDANKWIW